MALREFPAPIQAGRGFLLVTVSPPTAPGRMVKASVSSVTALTEPRKRTPVSALKKVALPVPTPFTA